MATLSDTPTQTILTSASEAGNVSIKIEQGVLPESDEYVDDGSECHTAERRGNQIDTMYESNTIDMERFSNSLGSIPEFHISHSIFETNIEIKAEPPVDIDDRQSEFGGEMEENNSSFKSQSPKPDGNIISPKIRLTPTSKLIATPNNATENKRRYACPYENCTKSYGKSSHLRSHLTWHTGIKPFVCNDPGCGKGFTRSDELNRHIRTHTGEKPFECVQCTKKFSRSDHLTKHLATHSKQLGAPNKLLAKRIKLNKTLPQTNVKTNSPVTVPTLNKEINVALNNTYPNFNFPDSKLGNTIITERKELEQNNDLKIKLESTDSDVNYAATPKGAITVTSCSRALTIANPNIKIETDINVKPEPFDETRLGETNNQSLEEEPDDDAIMPEANLPPLIQNVTPTKVAKLVKPSIKKPNDAAYDPSRPHPCSHCTKSFKRQDDLNRHMRTHTGEKPYACNECDKRFMRSDHLKKHINTHIRMHKNLVRNETPAAVKPPGPSIKLEHGV